MVEETTELRLSFQLSGVSAVIRRNKKTTPVKE